MNALVFERRRWTRRRGLVGAFLVVLAADLALGVQFLTLAAMASEPDGTSAVTVRWDDVDRDPALPGSDALAALEVTVSQTRNLSNQGVTVSWTGAQPTPGGEFAHSYLQIMQCWGAAAEGPRPETCQWGAPAPALASLFGANTVGRELVLGEDPWQSYGDDYLIPPPRSNPNLRAYAVPFESVRGVRTFTPSTLFSVESTNELTGARTGADGTGSTVFEVQTSLEAPHLGCGVVVNDAARPCWLVIVPRTDVNLDGSPSSSDPSGRITGSPLSAGNWAQRLEVALDFSPIGTDCPLGRAERRTVGTELVAEAMTSWQAALCQSGTTYGYSQIGDPEARRQIIGPISGAAGLAFINEPVDPVLAQDSTLVYAPVALSGVVIAFNIEYNVPSNSANASRNGTAVTDLALNQRLVAKLLTQSYRADVPDGNNQPSVSSNPRSLRHDPEFLRLNPVFADFSNASEPDGLIVSLGSSDAAIQVWRWVVSDPDARAFLSGVPDQWGMRINPAYDALDLDLEDADNFPKADLATYRQFPSIPEPGYGTLNLRPYVNDMLEGAYRTRRADANVRVVWDESRVPPSFVSGGAQVPGRRFTLALTDSASALRYGLPMARLVNAAGDAVAPTSESMMLAAEAMPTSSVTGVRVIDHDRRTRGVYPLTMLTYAVVNVCRSDGDELRDYAKLLEFVAGSGQNRGDDKGQLPEGYEPLSSAMTAQTVAVASSLRTEIATPKCAERQPAPTPDPTPDPTLTPDPTPPPTADDGPLIVDTGFLDPGVGPEQAEQSTSPVPVPEVPSALDAILTGSGEWSASQYGIAGAALLGLPCIVSGPLLLRRGASLR